MSGRSRLTGSVVPFARRWHVIDEIDLMRLIAGHRRLSELCGRLERCADALPGLPDDDEADSLCTALDAMIERDARDELPYLHAMFTRELDDPLALGLLDHVRLHHVADAGMAQDLRMALRPRPGGDETSPEVLGYMLRCFFTGCRRAMDFEELAILALAGKRLTRAARNLLTDSLCSRAAI